MLLESASIGAGLLGPRHHFGNSLRTGLSANAVAWFALSMPLGGHVGSLVDSDATRAMPSNHLPELEERGVND